MAAGSFVVKSAAKSSGAVVSKAKLLMYIIAGSTSGKQQVSKCTDEWSAPSQALVGRDNQCLMYTNQFMSSRGSRLG